VTAVYDSIAPDYDSLFLSRRDKAENEVLKELLSKVEGKVVDLGCGTGFFLEVAPRPTEDYVGVDISNRMLEKAEAKFPRHNFHKADMTKTGLPEGEFDSVVSLWAMHYADPEHAFKEATRLLRPGGQIVVITYGPWAQGDSPLPYETWGAYKKNNRRQFKTSVLRHHLRDFDRVQVTGLTPRRAPRLAQMFCLPLLTKTIGRLFPDSCYYLVATGVKRA